MVSMVEHRQTATLIVDLQVERQAIGQKLDYSRQIWDDLPSLSSSSARGRSLQWSEYFVHCEQSMQIAEKLLLQRGQDRSRVDLGLYQQYQHQRHNHTALRAVSRQIYIGGLMPTLGSSNHHLTHHQSLPYSGLRQTLDRIRSTGLSIDVSVMMFVEF
jgi:hypothetical protein